MAALSPIAPGISLEDLYSRLDAVRVEAAKVSDKANSSALSTLEAQVADKASNAALTALGASLQNSLQASVSTISLSVRDAIAHQVDSATRPGDGARAFVRGFQGGEAAALDPLPETSLALGDNGFAARAIGANVFAMRRQIAIEPGRTYRARFVFQRRANVADPANHAVRCGILWLDQARNILPVGSGSVVVDRLNPQVSDGRQEVTGTLSRTPGPGIDVVPPVTARYARAYVQTYGEDGVTDVEVIDIVDITDLALLPDLSAEALARLAGLESLNAGPRLGAVESAVQNPNSLTFGARSDAAAATIPTSVSTVSTRGLSVFGDARGSSYRRGTQAEFNVAAPGTAFRSADGAYWIRIDRSVHDYDLSNDALAAASRSLLYRRKVRYEIPLCPGAVQDALVAAGYTLPAYPTGLQPYHATNDLFVCQSVVAPGGATKGIICWYDISNGASPTLKTWWYTNQYSREGIAQRFENGRRYLYQLGDSFPYRNDITVPPAPGSSLPAEVFTNAAPSYFELTPYGDGWAYMASDVQNPGGLRVKQQFIVADSDFNKRAETRLPLNAIGSYFGRIQDYCPKCQGLDWREELGAFVLGCGGDYRPTPERLPEYRLRQSKQQGLIGCGANGDILFAALCDPEVALALTGAQIERVIRVHECEGVRTDSSNGKLYAIWQTLAPDEWPTVGRTRGVVITEEMCSDVDAVDYSVGATALKGTFDGRTRTHVAPFGRQLTHPILGTPITSVNELADMMIECSLLDVYFSGYNTPLSDLNGVSIPHANGYIRASYSVSANFRLEINFQSGGTRTYSFSGMGGIFHEGNSPNRAQAATPVYDGPTGIRYWGGASPTVDPVAAAVDGISIDPAGIVKMHRGASTALGLGRGAGDGYSLTLSRAGALIGGLYHVGSTVRLYTSPTTYFGIISGSPEGVAGGGIGSVLVDILTGNMWKKKSGSGNIGWAL